ncbi:MAG: hypothetical protein WDN69_36800 [Aliidongia sp.]
MAISLPADDTEALITRTKSAADSAVPAGNGVMVEVLARLYLLTGEESYRERAEALIAAFSGELERNFFPLASYLNGVDFPRRRGPDRHHRRSCRCRYPGAAPHRPGRRAIDSRTADHRPRCGIA